LARVLDTKSKSATQAQTSRQSPPASLAASKCPLLSGPART
jgi:hypothetical protein